MPYRHITLLTLAAFAFGLWVASRAERRRRQASRVHTEPHELQTWEGEGGGLPNGGAPLTANAGLGAADATP